MNNRNLHIIFKNILILFTIFFVSNTLTFAQTNKDLARLESLVRLADKQFELAYYQNAADYYNKALEIKPADAHVNFYLAECYRNLFLYDKARDKYKTASENDLQNYPMSSFYYALMLKFEGQYEKSLDEFRNFIDKTKDISPNNFKDKRIIFQRVLIEMEGCYWSQEQLFEYKIFQLPEPVNSKYNDFAPTIFKNDTNILLVSGRLKSKYQAKNDLGEGFTDFFNLIKTDKWEETESEDKISKINTDFYEGAGIFNSVKKVFYFTRCGGDNDGHCMLYSTELGLTKKWSDPKALNSLINDPESDNKQPALSPNGDTLFFVSNRAGGYGENDIWFSVWDSNKKDWTMPVNMGMDINTPFNEITPFYYANENSLFFASDGHKGFGGTDIFIAKTNASGNYSVTNIGSPFNSNSDDCYLDLGSSKGYFSSNRAGSIGEFDIYSFNNMFEKNKYANYHQILDSLAKDLSNLKYDVKIEKPELPEELVSADLQDVYDRILSAKYAALVYNVVMIFNEVDYKTFEALSIDDKSIIDMFYMSEEVGITEIKIDSISAINSTQYASLDFNEKGFVDKMSEAYLSTSGGASFIKMSKTEQDYYNSLKLEEKQRIDLLINYKIKTEKDKLASQNANSLITDNFGIKDFIDKNEPKFTFDEYESLISKKLSGFLHGNELNYNQLEYDICNKMDPEDQSLLEMDYKSRAFDLTDENIKNIIAEDKKLYTELDIKIRPLIDMLAVKQLAAKNEDFVVLDTAQIQFYGKINIAEKRKYDRLLALRFSQLFMDSMASVKKEITDIIPNIDTTIVNQQKQNEYQRLVSPKLAGFVYKLKFPYNETDYLLSKSLTAEDLGFIDIIYNSRVSEINENILDAIHKTDINNYEKTAVAEKNIINSIATKYSKADNNSEYIYLNDEEKLFFQNLNLEQKEKTDLLIAYKYAQLQNERIEAAIKYADISANELEINKENEIGKIFTAQELTNIQKLLSFKTAMFIHHVSEPYLSPDYYMVEKMSVENSSILDVLYDSKVFTYKDADVVMAIRQADENQYKLLNKTDKEFIERQTELFILGEDSAVYISMTPQDSSWYASLNLDSKYKIDRLLMYNLNLRLNPPKTLVSTEDYLVSDFLYIDELAKTGKILSPEEAYNYERIVSFMLAQKIHEIEIPFLQNDFQIKNYFTKDDLSIVDFIYTSKLSAIKDKNIVDSLQLVDQSRFASTFYENISFVNSAVNQYNTTKNEDKFIQLEEADSGFYSQLSIKQKYQIDRFIAMKIKNIINSKMIASQLNTTLKSDELNIQELKNDASLVSSAESNSFDRLMTFMLANYIYDVKIPFNELDYKLIKNLDIEQLSVFDMMVSIKKYALEQENSLSTIKSADKTILENIDTDKNALINEIIDCYSKSKDSVDFVAFNANLQKKYQNLSNDQKFEIDRLVALQLSDVLKNKQKVKEIEEKLSYDEFSNSILDISENSDLVSKPDYEVYQKILVFKIANYIHGIDVDFNEADLTMDDKSIIDMMFETKTYSLDNEEVKKLLQKSDEENYNTVSVEDKLLIDSIVDSYINKSDFSAYVKLSPTVISKLQLLDVESKSKIDRAVACKLRQLMSNTANNLSVYEKDNLVTGLHEIALTSNILTQEDISKYEKILSFKVANYIYNLNLSFIESDKNIVNSFNLEDNSLLDMMFTARVYMISDNDIANFKNADKLLYSNLEQTEKGFIEVVVSAYDNQKKSNKVVLNSSESEYYKNLNLIEKNRIDRLIAYKISASDTELTRFESGNSFNFSLQNLLCKTIGISARISNSSNLKASLFDGSKFVISTITDDLGNFKFENLKQGGDYIIRYDSNLSDNLSLTDFKINCEQLDNNEVKIIRDTVIIQDNANILINSAKVDGIENVFFEFNSSKLTEESKNILDLMSDYYKSKNNASIILKGYTDNTGSENYNLKLSYNRTKNVYKYFISKGVYKEDIILSSFGKENPLVPNKSEKLRKLNRRVQIVIID